MSDENVGGFEEWFAAQWGIGGNRQIALSAWNAALSAHGENASVQTPVVDEAMVERFARGYFGDRYTSEVAQLLLPTLRKAWRDGLTSALTGADHE